MICFIACGEKQPTGMFTTVNADSAMFCMTCTYLPILLLGNFMLTTKRLLRECDEHVLT